MLRVAMFVAAEPYEYAQTQPEVPRFHPRRVESIYMELQVVNDHRFNLTLGMNSICDTKCRNLSPRNFDGSTDLTEYSATEEIVFPSILKPPANVPTDSWLNDSRWQYIPYRSKFALNCAARQLPYCSVDEKHVLGTLWLDNPHISHIPDWLLAKRPYTIIFGSAWLCNDSCCDFHKIPGMEQLLSTAHVVQIRNFSDCFKPLLKLLPPTLESLHITTEHVFHMDLITHLIHLISLHIESTVLILLPTEIGYHLRRFRNLHQASFQSRNVDDCVSFISCVKSLRIADLRYVASGQHAPLNSCMSPRLVLAHDLSHLQKLFLRNINIHTQADPLLNKMPHLNELQIQYTDANVTTDWVQKLDDKYKGLAQKFPNLRKITIGRSVRHFDRAQ